VSRQAVHTTLTLTVTPRHRQGSPVSLLSASIVTETNVSPVFFAANQTHVDLDAAHAQVSSLTQSASYRL
jgi:hypothetical protein